MTEAPFLLRKNISKFLKYQFFIKTCAALTLRAYMLDLEQAFQIFKDERNWTWKNLQAGEWVPGEGDLYSQPGPEWSESDLLQHSREALHRWAPLSPASRNRKTAALKSFFSWAYAEGLIRHDLSDRLHSPRVPHHLPHFISVDEVQSLIHSFRQEKDLPPGQVRREQALLLLLYGGGLRVSEACRLKWIAVDEPRRVLRVLGKGGKERLVPIPAAAMEAVSALREGSPGPFVFGEEALNPRVAYEWIRQRGHKAGLHHQLHPHALRHSYATHLLSGGANLRTLQELLGHESLRATEKYTHLSVDQLARTMEKTHPLGKKSTK